MRRQARATITPKAPRAMASGLSDRWALGSTIGAVVLEATSGTLGNGRTISDSTAGT